MLVSRLGDATPRRSVHTTPRTSDTAVSPQIQHESHTPTVGLLGWGETRSALHVGGGRAARALGWRERDAQSRDLVALGVEEDSAM